MLAERCTHARIGAAPAVNSSGSKSTCSAAPATCNSLPGASPAVDASTSNAPSAAAAAVSAAVAARGVGAPSARRLPEEHAPGFLGHGCLGVDRGGFLIGPERRGPIVYGVEPALKMREIFQLLPLGFIRNDPRVAGDIGDRAF